MATFASCYPWLRTLALDHANWNYSYSCGKWSAKLEDADNVEDLPSHNYSRQYKNGNLSVLQVQQAFERSDSTEWPLKYLRVACQMISTTWKNYAAKKLPNINSWMSHCELSNFCQPLPALQPQQPFSFNMPFKCDVKWSPRGNSARCHLVFFVYKRHLYTAYDQTFPSGLCAVSYWFGWLVLLK